MHCWRNSSWEDQVSLSIERFLYRRDSTLKVLKRERGVCLLSLHKKKLKQAGICKEGATATFCVALPRCPQALLAAIVSMV